MQHGTGCSAHSASLDSAAPMNPTGQPMIAAGRGQAGSSSMLSRWNKAVGALPIATTAPCRCGRQSSSAAAERVVDIDSASSRTTGSCKVQITSLLPGNRERVTPSLTMRASHRIGAPATSAARAACAKPVEKCSCASSPIIPAAWTMRTAIGSSSASKRARSASARIMAKERR